MTGPPHPFDSFRMPLISAWPPPDCYAPEDTLLDSESSLAWGVRATKLGEQQIISLARDIIEKAESRLGIKEIRTALDLEGQAPHFGSAQGNSPELTSEEYNELTRRFDDGDDDIVYNSLVARMRLFILVTKNREMQSESISMHVDDVRKFEGILTTWLDLFSRIEDPFTVDADVRIGLQDVLRDTEEMSETVRMIQEKEVGELR